MSTITLLPRPRSGTMVPAADRQVRLAAQLVGRVQIFGRAPGPYTIAWRDTPGSPRKRAMRSTWKAAHKLATRIDETLANHTVEMACFTEADRAAYRSALEAARPTGEALLHIAGDRAQSCALLREKLPTSATIPSQLDLAKAWLEHVDTRSTSKLSAPELVTKLLADKQDQVALGQLSQGYYDLLDIHLENFATFWRAPLRLLRSPDVNAWLRSLKKGGKPLGPRSRHNYRASLDTLCRWAQSNGHLPKAWDEMARVPDPGTRIAEIKILTPEQMTALISGRQFAEDHGRASKSLVPFLALQAFAGIRHAELNGEKPPLDWRDVHLAGASRYIYVPKDTDKTGRGRVVPISDNLAAWLMPYAKRNGPVCSLASSHGALLEAKAAAKIPAGENETRNILRHSFISYRLAIVKSIGQVAEEAGNSPAMIRKHYNRPIPESEAQRWFDIHPTAAGVLQLNFAAAGF